MEKETGREGGNMEVSKYCWHGPTPDFSACACHTVELHCTGLERPCFALWCLSSMQCRPWVPFRQDFGHIVQAVHQCCYPYYETQVGYNYCMPLWTKGSATDTNIGVQVCFGLLLCQPQNNTADSLPGPAQYGPQYQGKEWTPQKQNGSGQEVSGRNQDWSGTTMIKEKGRNVRMESIRRRCRVEKNTGPASCQCVRTWALQIDLCLGLVCSTVVFGSLKHIKGGEQIQWLPLLTRVS